MYNISTQASQKTMKQERPDRTPLPLDFDAEVKIARAEFSEQLAGITFIRFRNENAVEELTAALTAMSHDFRRWLLQTPDDSAVDLSAEMMLSKPGSFAARDPFSGKGIIVFDDHDLLGHDTGIHQETQKRMALWHEIAHLLVDDANQAELLERISGTVDITEPDNHPAILALLEEEECARENLADGIMAATGLRQGWLPADDVRKAALYRAKTSFCHVDISHLTTMTLDEIAKAAQTSDFRSLTPKEALAFGSRLARLNTPPVDEAAQIRTMRFKADLPSTALARVFTKCAQDPDSHTAYIAARLLAHEIETARDLMPVERKRLATLISKGAP